MFKLTKAKKILIFVGLVMLVLGYLIISQTGLRNYDATFLGFGFEDGFILMLTGSATVAIGLWGIYAFIPFGRWHYRRKMREEEEKKMKEIQDKKIQDFINNYRR